jgi:gamma-glutamyltranspeptidase/glutathione hydrolase
MKRIIKRVLATLLVLLALVGAATGYALQKLRATVFNTVPAPEAATGLRTVDARTYSKFAVVAAHPEATRIGEQVLAAGGSAIDAAVAVQAALTLVEPQSSGIGGGAFLLYWDAPSQRLFAFDGRETAPAAATPKLFLGEDGKALAFPVALLGGRSVGVPGVVRMLGRAQARFGKKPWSELFHGAASLASRGFTVTSRLNALVAFDPVMPALPLMRSHFYGVDGWPRKVGDSLSSPLLSQTLEQLAAGGPDSFYSGPIAQDIVAAVRGARRPTMARGIFNAVARQWGVATEGEATVEAPGGMTLDDLAKYEPVEREPLCLPYRRYRLCTMPPPAGGVSVLQLMGLLAPYELSKLDDTELLHLFLQAEALVDADRDRWVGDPAFVNAPTAGLLDPGYLDERRKLISTGTPAKEVKAGRPPGTTAALSGESFELPSTSHFVVVDADGSVACMTTSIEFGFGSHVMVRGFVLNNQLTDFAFTPEHAGEPVFNAVAGGKRPRSAMAPVIVFDAQSGKPVLAVGSPGGPRIIAYVARTLIGVLDRGLSPSEAIAMPHVLMAKGKVEVEDVGWKEASAREALVTTLKAKQYEVSVTQENSGLHAVEIRPNQLRPGIDPRREGTSAGE